MLAPGVEQKTNTNNLSDIFEEINSAGKKQKIVSHEKNLQRGKSNVLLTQLKFLFGERDLQQRGSLKIPELFTSTKTKKKKDISFCIPQSKYVFFSKIIHTSGVSSSLSSTVSSCYKEQYKNKILTQSVNQKQIFTSFSEIKLDSSAFVSNNSPAVPLRVLSANPCLVSFSLCLLRSGSVFKPSSAFRLPNKLALSAIENCGCLFFRQRVERAAISYLQNT